jgi:hypothetical protein
MKNNMKKEILNMYVDSINNSFGNQSVISGFCNTLICSSNASDSEKIITVPNGYTNTDAYVTIRVLFLNGYYDTSTISNPMTLTVQHEDGTYFDGTSTPTSYPIKSYQNGVLDNLQIHEITQTDYRVIDPNTCIELYFDGTQFVVVGNPLVLSSSDYSIYANGKIVDDGLSIGAISSFYGPVSNNNWLLCDGRDTTGTAEELATHYPALYTYLGNSNVLPTQFDHSELSDFETITLPTTASASITMDYDGILSTTFTNIAGGGAFRFAVYVNDIAFWGGSGGSGNTGDTVTVPFKKGDKVYYYSDGQSTYTSYVRYYKQPLYIKAT